MMYINNIYTYLHEHTHIHILLHVEEVNLKNFNDLAVGTRSAEWWIIDGWRGFRV